MNFIFRCVWSDRMTDEEYDLFATIHRKTFGSTVTRDFMKYKYKNNIYGSSLIVFAYDENGNPAGARGFWRNDIDGKRAFQPVDTCTLKEYRRQGQFSQSIDAALELLPSDAIIYNYPNDNSIKQYLKHGWEEKKKFYQRLFVIRNYDKEYPRSFIDSNYLNWWILKDKRHFFYIKKGERFFLCKDCIKPHRFYVIGEISESDAQLLNKAKPWTVFYYSEIKSLYIRKDYRPLIVVSRCNDSTVNYYNWKVDAI